METESILGNTGARFSSAPWADMAKQLFITIIGAGGIGSWTALQLSRLSPATIYIFDDDKVENVNLSGQLFGRNDIGVSKTSCIVDRIHDLSNYYLIAGHNRRYEPQDLCSSISMRTALIMAVDNMESRRALFKRWVSFTEAPEISEQDANIFKNNLFIDGRLAAEKLQIFAFRKRDANAIATYERDWLFRDEEADPTACSYKQTSFVAGMIGSLITNIIVNYCNNLASDADEGLVERPLPFLTEYDASQMLFNIDLSV